MRVFLGFVIGAVFMLFVWIYDGVKHYENYYQTTVNVESFSKEKSQQYSIDSKRHHPELLPTMHKHNDTLGYVLEKKYLGDNQCQIQCDTLWLPDDIKSAEIITNNHDNKQVRYQKLTFLR